MHQIVLEFLILVKPIVMKLQSFKSIFIAQLVKEKQIRAPRH